MLNHRQGGMLSIDHFFDSGMYKKAYNIKYYTDKNGKVIVDKILKFENLHEELQSVFNMLEIDFSTGLNENEKGNYKKYRNISYHDVFTPGQIALITFYYDEEFSLWGYDRCS
jgi:hypothetical protein